ncbi:MAG: type IV secretion system DNA-binding domain-containing protein [Candidatus Niyogibacteria bacterium]|nr:MAG: type IV secretion system DNA-binding domain-containing protein [Candidatus Niyogibacteria bacterium]
MAKDTVYFARTNFRGENKIFGIKVSDRRQHTYIIGKTGTGKSALIKNFAIQDINSGKGICVVDPHGELVEELLSRIPKDRIKDVIYFNPADTDFPLGFNVLEVPDKKYKHLVAQGLIGIFTKIWANVWSARMEYILQNCILALIETPGTTLLGIQRILTDKDYRQRILANVTDPVVRAFWVNEYEVWQERFRNEAIVPIQNKVGQFVSTSLIRNIVGQTKSSFDAYELMNEGKILLANISKGRVGEENSMLLGAMLITKVQLAAMERVRIPEEEREDYYLYVDEFQNFATEAFASILSEARKYRLNLIIAHQYTGQLVSETSTKVRDAVFGNVGTMIAFRVGATDAEFLEKEFEPEFTIQDLVDLPNYNIYLKLMVNGVASRPFSAITLPPLETTKDMVSPEEIIESSREKYGRLVDEVELDIKKWSGSLPSVDTENDKTEAESAASKSERFETPCWICKKSATIPFKPDGRRPVYCSDCLKKIESGQLQPLRPLPTSRADREEFGGNLGLMGIEFLGKPAPSSSGRFTQPKTPEKSASRAGNTGRQSGAMPITSGGPVIKKTPSEKTLSLDDLKAKAWQNMKRDKNIQIEELRKALKESMADEEKSEKKPEEEHSKSKTLKPGDSIKFN